MHTRTCIFLVLSAMVPACTWVAGCGGDGGEEPVQASADKFVRQRKLEPDVPPPPEPSPNISGSLEPPAPAPAPGTAAPAPGTAAPAAGTAAPAATN